MEHQSVLSPSPGAATTASASFDRSGPNLTVYLSGELDAASAPSITAAIFEHLRPGDERLWLDLSALTFCDSSGIALLFRLNQRAEDDGFHLALMDPTAPVRRILEICDAGGTLAIRS